MITKLTITDKVAKHEYDFTLKDCFVLIAVIGMVYAGIVLAVILY